MTKQLIQQGKWDRVLLDLAIPDISGFDIIENLENYFENIKNNQHS